MPARRASSVESAAPVIIVTEQQRKANVRLGLILATVSLALAVGFVVRMAWFGH